MKARTGTLLKRGAVYYLRFVFDGRPIVRRLTTKDADGIETAITTKDEAERARVRLMDGWTKADQKKAEENLLAKITGRAAELAQFEAGKPGLAVKEGWNAFQKSARRPDSGERTLEAYACQWDRFARWMEEHHPAATLKEVSPSIAESYARNLADSCMAPNTYNKHLTLLQMVFRVLSHNPEYRTPPVNPWTADQLPRKRLAPHSRRELTLAELQTVCTTAQGEMRTLFGVGLYTGLRLGDCATLQWGEVDLDRGRIARVPNKTRSRSGKPVLVPLHRALWQMLAETPPRRRRGDVLPETAELYRTRPDALTKRIQDIFHACGIATASAVPTGPRRIRKALDVGFHSLRHSFVSLCRASNVPLAVVEAIVGHSNPAMTRLYSHTGEDAARLAVASLPLLGTAAPVRRAPAERAARLLAAVERADPAMIKRAVLRLIRAHFKHS
jgi:integrase